MRKRRSRILIWSAVAAVAFVLVGLTVLGEFLDEIFAYTADTMCSKQIDPPEPRQEVIYLACGDVPAQAPTFN
jgi:hypothetical protein